jgi:hypothetical protein
MINARLRLAFAEETMFPYALPRSGFALANPDLAKGPRAPFFLRTWGTSRFPTPLPDHAPTEVGA